MRLSSSSLLLLAATFGLVPSVRAEAASSSRSLDDYRHFRALSIDLVGRMPTRAEIAAFEAPSFDLDRWIDDHLQGAAYADRLSRVYRDVMRLEVGPAIVFKPPSMELHRVTIKGPDGAPIYLYYRPGQRRAREATDGEVCLTKAEAGATFTPDRPPVGDLVAVKKAALEANTVLVKPWWLYRDYRSASPVLRYGAAWTNPDPGYVLDKDLLLEADGKTPVEAIRVCKEEALSAATGTIFATGRTKPKPGTPPPFDRARPLPLDDGYATKHKGDVVACDAGALLALSTDCGCGVGLERCIPSEKQKAFVIPAHAPLGIDEPLDLPSQNSSEWMKLWWSQEATHFFSKLFAEDRDFREVLTARWSVINGPLAQFYRFPGAQSFGRARAFGLLDDGVPLFDPKAVPSDLTPHDVSTWTTIDDRGPLASGLLTMPVYLTKYASRRARGANLYTTFLCKSFTASTVELAPSTETNLMIRPGCSSCHATLEPLAAYFARISETDWRYLPESAFPIESPKCKLDGKGALPGFCRGFYDPAFSTRAFGTLAGAYASHDHVAAGPSGAAREIVGSPDFASCAVERMTSSFLGRSLNADDEPLEKALAEVFVNGGFHMRPLIRAILRSSTYRRGNDERSDVWRSHPAPTSSPTTGGAK